MLGQRAIGVDPLKPKTCERPGRSPESAESSAQLHDHILGPRRSAPAPRPRRAATCAYQHQAYHVMLGLPQKLTNEKYHAACSTRKHELCISRALQNTSSQYQCLTAQLSSIDRTVTTTP